MEEHAQQDSKKPAKGLENHAELETAVTRAVTDCSDDSDLWLSLLRSLSSEQREQVIRFAQSLMEGEVQQ